MQSMNAKGFVLGVWNNWDKLGQRLDTGRISTALQGHLCSGRSNDWWPYYIPADPYQNWVDEKTLSRFFGNACEETVSELSEGMLKIARATEQTIDTVLCEWRRQQESKH